MILTILPTYIAHLSGVVNHDSVPRDFEYALVTAYLLNWICIVLTDQDKIVALKFSDLNLGDRKFTTCSPHIST
jgi:hypothetical protein